MVTASGLAEQARAVEVHTQHGFVDVGDEGRARPAGDLADDHAVVGGVEQFEVEGAQVGYGGQRGHDLPRRAAQPLGQGCSSGIIPVMVGAS